LVTGSKNSNKRSGAIFGLLCCAAIITALLLSACAGVRPASRAHAGGPTEAVEAPEAPDIDKLLEGAGDRDDEKAAEAEVSEREAEFDIEELDEERRARAERLVEAMTYLVYESAAGETDFETETAVKKANEILASRGREYVEYAQIKQLLQKQADLFDRETGGSISRMRWGASKFHTDIYVPLQVKVRVEKRNGIYYAGASAAMIFRRTETGEELARAAAESREPETASTSEEAVRKAVETVVEEAMNSGLAAARGGALRSVGRGCPYTIELRSTFDEDTLQGFVKSLEKEVESLERIESNSERTRLRVRYIGTVTELEDTVLDTAGESTGMERMFLVYQRGDTVIFNTGN
jgi:hypothetical protein